MAVWGVLTLDMITFIYKKQKLPNFPKSKSYLIFHKWRQDRILDLQNMRRLTWPTSPTNVNKTVACGRTGEGQWFSGHSQIENVRQIMASLGFTTNK